MAYRLDASDGLDTAIRRVGASQLDHALTSLEDDLARDPVAAVHAARKDIKKVRSLLRLSRPALGPRVYRRDNATLRDAARALSATRDADVLVAASADLAERYVGHVPASSFDALSHALTERARANGQADADPVAQAATAIRSVRDRVEHWPLETTSAKTLSVAFERAYARGQDALAAVRADPQTEAIHDWRKRVKDLWYFQRLLSPAWPTVLQAQADEAHVLSELLGDEHDLAVLRTTITSGEVMAPADLDAIVDLIDQRRGELLDAALQLGRRIYAESPEASSARLRAYLKAWEASAARSLSPTAGGAAAG